MTGHGNNGKPGDLCQGDYSLLHDIAGPARAVGCNGQIITAIGPGGQFEQGLRTAAAGGASHGLDVETFEDAGKKSAVLARADQGDQAGSSIAWFDVAVMDFHGDRQTIVPDGINGRAGWRTDRIVRAIVP